MMSAVSRNSVCHLFTQIKHRRAFSYIWRCVTSSCASASEANRASSKLSHLNRGVRIMYDVRHFERISHRRSCLGCSLLHYVMVLVQIALLPVMLNDSRLYWPPAR